MSLTLLAQRMAESSPRTLETRRTNYVQPKVRLFTPEEVQRRFYQFCQLNTIVFRAFPENQRWSMDPRGCDPRSDAWDPSSNSYSYFTGLLGSDFFGCVKESDSLAALQVGRKLDEEFIVKHGFEELGMQPGDYYQVVILTALQSQHQGYGKALVSALIEQAERLYCPRIWTRCRVGNQRSFGMLTEHGGFVKHCQMGVSIGGTISVRDILRRDLF